MTPGQEPRRADGAPPPDDEARLRTRAAFAQFQTVLTEVASSVIERIDERCPYRAREDRCTFAGGCVNQRRQPRAALAAVEGERVVWCAGDHQLRRTER